MREIPATPITSEQAHPSLVEVKAEVAAFKARVQAAFGEALGGEITVGWQRRITGNFSMLVMPPDTGFARSAAKELPDLPNREVMEGYDASKQSRLYLNQTPREFLSVVDGVIADCAIDVYEINGLENPANPRTEQERAEHPLKSLPEEEKAAIILPAYERLLAKGYTAADLLGTLDMSNMATAELY